MDPRSRLRICKRIVNAFLLLSLVTWVQGQQTATCTSANSWLDNGDGQSPCDVASALLSPCTSTPILPLVGEANYPNNAPECSCNTVVFNLFSACAYCQGGNPSDFKSWTQNCGTTPVEYMSFPQNSLNTTVKTPLWAFVNVTSDDTFDLISIQKAVTPPATKWTTIQILLPILTVIATLLVGGIAVYFIFRRIRGRYEPIGDHTHSRAPSDQSSFYVFPSRSQYSHSSKHSSKKSTSSSHRSRPKVQHWEQANLRNPNKKYGFFAPSVRKVRSSERGVGWSITEEDENGGTHSRALSATSLALINEEPEVGPSHATSSTASAVVSGGQSFLPIRKGKTGSPPRPSGDTGVKGTQTVRPPSLPSSGPLPSIQDSPDVNLINTRPVRGVGGTRPPLMHIVSTQPPRGFHIDDTDSAKSPGAADQPTGGPLPQSVPHPLATTTTAVPRSENSVMLISKTPGENFTIPSSSLPVSPISQDEWETVSSPQEIQVKTRWPPAFSDSSPVLPKSLSRDSGPSRSQSGNSPEDAIFPPAVRAAGYAPNSWHGRGSGSTSVPSSHASSSGAYTVPNPFTFNSRKENPLRGTLTQSSGPSANANRLPFDIDE